MEASAPPPPFDYIEFMRSFPHHYPYECVGIIAFLLYVQLYFMGNTTNKRIALKFVQSTYAFFKGNFTQVGVTN